MMKTTMKHASIIIASRAGIDVSSPVDASLVPETFVLLSETASSLFTVAVS